MTNVGTVDYRTDARGQTLPPVLPAHAPPLQLHNGRESVQEDRNLGSPPVVSVGSGSDGPHFGFLADQGGIAASSVHGMMVLNQPVYVSSVGGSSVPLGMAVNVQSEGMASNSQTGSSSQEEASSPSSPANTDDLRTVLRQQLEYYFSKDNLSTDKYLLSQMDGDHYVPVSVIANFNQVKKLTADMDQVVEAIKGSGVLQLDETGSKVRAVPEKRCILILREIPKETAHESIMELFQGKSCPRILGCQFAENDCWYVTFGSEEEAQEAHRYLREEVREFLGNPIRARIKNTAITRPSSVPKPRPQFPYPTAVQVYNGQTVPFYPQQSGMVNWSPYYNAPYNTPTSTSYTAPPLSGGRFPSHGSASGGNAGGGASGRGRNVGGRIHHNRHADGLVAGGTGRLPSNSSSGGGSHYGPTGSGGGRYNRRDSEERNRNLPNRLKKQRSEDSGRQRSQNRPPQKLDFALNNFPPLPGSDGTQVCPPPAPPPPALPDEGASNLADIVKGRKNKDGGSVPEKSASAPTTPTCISLASNGTSSGSNSSAIAVSKTSSTPVQPVLPVTPPHSPVPPPSPPPVSLPTTAIGPTAAVVNQVQKLQRVGEKARS